VPALIIVNVTMVAVMLLVAQPPAVVWHQNEAVQEVAHGVIELQGLAADGQ
jgi:hypothetical protein